MTTGLASQRREDARVAPAALARRLGTAAATDAATCRAYAIGGVVPSVVARPADQAELAATVGAAVATGAALVPLGRGAHRALGHPPERYDVALVTERLGRVVEYTPADMTLTVEAGTTLAEVATLLAREGQWLPLDPPLPDATTIGGLVAADLTGPLAATHGRVRDYLIGMRAVTAAGVVVRAGGRVVKNVAGYDLMKLVVGSLGTLAVLGEATFKVRPLPERRHDLVLAAAGMTDALELGAGIEGALAVSARGALHDREHAATVVIRLGGVDADVAIARARIIALAERRRCVVVRDVDADDPMMRADVEGVRDFTACAPGDVVVRLATLPSRLGAVAGAATAALGDAPGAWLADPRRGVVTLALAAMEPSAIIASLASVAEAHGAHVVVERFPDALARTVEVWHPLPPAFALMRRMKAALDPAGTLAPGRFVGRL